MNEKYWIEVKRYIIGGKWRWTWLIKCCNGRIKAESNTIYDKRSLCFNDSKVFADSVNMEVGNV